MKVTTKKELRRIIDQGFIPLDTINVSSIRSFEGLFQNIHEINGSISSWDTSSVTNMKSMFEGSRLNEDISNWDTSKVTNMTGMFRSSKFNSDISKWDTSSVTSMAVMFYKNFSFNSDISKWNVSKVENMSFMFSFAPFNQDISSWDISSVKELKMMFCSSNFKRNLGTWDLENKDDTGFLDNLEYKQYRIDRENYLVSLNEEKYKKSIDESLNQVNENVGIEFEF